MSGKSTMRDSGMIFGSHKSARSGVENIYGDGGGVGLTHSLSVPRREFLAKLAALGATSLIPGAAAFAQTQTAAKPRRIDVHYHFSSPGFISAITARKTGQRPLMEWTPAKAIEAMDKGGVATSMGSISEPGVWFGDGDEARKLARETNEYGARLMADYPGRFGLFASLPMPDIDATLREIEYSLDTLKADGVCFMTSYAGKYLGDPAFAPVMDELNRRKAVVYTHPFRAECCINLLPDGAGLGITLVNDTTYTIASVLFSGTAARCPDIRFIWSHGGGTMPYITGRFSGGNRPDMAQKLPRGVMYEIQKFYYDTAQAVSPYTLAALTRLVPMSHILFGTDYPFATAETDAKGLTDFGLSAGDMRAIERDNSLELFPRLKTST
ncbi:MAG: amidohydrolase [Acidobacteriia bacterium]|nr:amidohydrolase [Terriglobia bacterium]